MTSPSAKTTVSKRRSPSSPPHFARIGQSSNHLTATVQPASSGHAGRKCIVNGVDKLNITTHCRSTGATISSTNFSTATDSKSTTSSATNRLCTLTRPVRLDSSTRTTRTNTTTPNPNKLHSNRDYNWSHLLNGTSNTSIKAARMPTVVTSDTLKSSFAATESIALEAPVELKNCQLDEQVQRHRHRQQQQQPQPLELLLSGHSATSSSVASECPGLLTQLAQLSLQQFDPQRTLHFLVTELTSRLVSLLPDNQFVHSTLSDIRRTMDRLSNSPAIVTAGDGSAEISSEKCTHQYATDAEHRALLTQFEQLTEQFSALQVACDELRSENDGLQLQLGRCKEQAAAATRDMAVMKQAHRESSQAERQTFVDLTERCARLQSQLDAVLPAVSERRMADAQHEQLVGQLAALNAKLVQSSDTIATLDRSRRADTAQLVSTALEKEKLSILLKCREKQMLEIGKELSDIHELAQRQIDVLNRRIPAPSNADGGCEVGGCRSCGAISTIAGASSSSTMSISANSPTLATSSTTTTTSSSSTTTATSSSSSSQEMETCMVRPDSSLSTLNVSAMTAISGSSRHSSSSGSHIRNNRSRGGTTGNGKSSSGNVRELRLAADHHDGDRCPESLVW